MSSLDKMLQNSAPDNLRETSLVSPVMAKIKQSKARARLVNRALIGCLVIGVLGLVAALLKGNTFQIINLAVHKVSSLQAHPGLFARALIETLPWPLIGTIAGIALAARIMQRNKVALVRHATAGMAIAAGALLVTASASAATIVTTDNQPGPAQQELERTVNGIGKQQVFVDGKIYELAAGQFLTDIQLRAKAEEDRLGEFKQTLDLPKATDTGYLDYYAYITAVSAESITLVDPPGYFIVGQTPETPAVLALDSQTIYLNGAVKANHIDLKPGDLVDVAIAKNLKTAAFVSKLTYSLEDYKAGYKIGISSIASARRKDGKCFNNEVDVCPNLPAVHDIIGLNVSEAVPADGVIREVFGELVSYDSSTFKVKTSSGAIWTFSDFGSITAINQSGYYNPSDPAHSDFSMQIKAGDYLRVEFWQHKTDLSKRDVINQAFSGTKDQARQLAAEGRLNISPDMYIRSVQIALKQPWYAGQTPVKYKP